MDAIDNLSQSDDLESQRSLTDQVAHTYFFTRTFNLAFISSKTNKSTNA